MSRWLVYCVGSVIFWGIWAILFSAASTAVSPLVVLVLSTLGLLPVVSGLVFSKRVRQGANIKRGIAWGIATGLAGAIGNVAYSEAILRGGEASVVTPLTAMYPAVTLILAVAFLRERVNFVQVGGVLLALVAIFLFNGTDASGAVDTNVWQTSLAAPWMAGALFALALYGLQGIALKLSTNDVSDELATICYFVGSALVTFLVLATQPIDWSMPIETWILAIGSGVAMGLALLIGFAAYRGGSASVVTALLALYPIVTVLLAIVFLGDQMTVVKAVAIGIAITAGLALAYEGRSSRKEETAPIAIDSTESEAATVGNQ